MKKIIAVALLACMTLTFAGCSGNDNKEESKGQVSIAESSAEESSEEESSEAESSAEESSKQESSKAESSAQESKQVEPSSKAESSAAAPQVSAVQESPASEEPSQTQVIITTQEVPVEQPQAQEQPQEQPAEEPKPQELPPYGAFSTQDLTVSFNGNTIGLMTKAEDMINAFGNASSVESVPSCLSMDAPDDKIYHYSAFDAQSLTEGGVEKVYNFDIRGAGVYTSRNIAVGSSKAEVESAYGKASSSDDFIAVYQTGDGRNSLEFYFENDKVTEIIVAYAP